MADYFGISDFSSIFALDKYLLLRDLDGGQTWLLFFVDGRGGCEHARGLSQTLTIGRTARGGASTAGGGQN